jgi:hypothetical protein
MLTDIRVSSEISLLRIEGFSGCINANKYKMSSDVYATCYRVLRDIACWEIQVPSDVAMLAHRI